MKFGALRARSFNSRDKSLQGIDIVACMGVLAVRVYALVRLCPLYHLLSVVLEHKQSLPFVPFIVRRAGTCMDLTCSATGLSGV